MPKLSVSLIVLSFMFITGCVTNYVKEGYSSQEDYQLAQEWGTTIPTQNGLNLLKGKGITTKAQFDAVAKEMSSANYPSSVYRSDIDAVLDYLDDKQIAESNNISIVNARNKRIAQQQAEQAREEAETEKKKQQFLKEYPYLLVITCEFSGENQQIEACFAGKNKVRTELEIRNGNEYRMYTIYDISEAGRIERGELSIPLRKRFMVQGQNARDHVLLTFRIYDSATQQLIYKKSAAKYDVIAISN